MALQDVIVPGLREHVPGHWQTLLAKRLPRVRSVPPMGRTQLDRERRVAALDAELAGIDVPVVLVAHSGGVITVAHWASHCRRPIQGALLAAPADMERAMPAGYPSVQELADNGWLPVPRRRLPFPSIVGASINDPLGRFDRVAQLADDWGSTLVNIGAVGHLNPASGHGEWAQADALIRELVASTDAPAREPQQGERRRAA
jgi:predicted alpha/beta hydrolase family esterase